MAQKTITLGQLTFKWETEIDLKRTAFFFFFFKSVFRFLVEGGFDVRKFLLLMRWSCTHFESHLQFMIKYLLQSIKSSDEEKLENEIAPSWKEKSEDEIAPSWKEKTGNKPIGDSNTRKLRILNMYENALQLHQISRFITDAKAIYEKLLTSPLLCQIVSNHIEC